MRITQSLAEQIYNYRYVEEATSRLVGGTDTQNWLAPQLHVVVKNWEGYFSCGSPP